MHVFRFGDFTLVPRERQLRYRHATVALPGKAFDLLVALAADSGRLISKDELLLRVWPGVIVEEVNLSVNISLLRKALGIAPEAGDWIETVPRRGYRFRAPGSIAVLPVQAKDPEQARVADGIAEGITQADAHGATASSEAHQQYLLGRFLWNQRSEESLKKAVSHFERAIQIDPAFAVAHAALADAHTTLGYLGYSTPVSTFPMGRPHALRALELDPSLAQAHASLAYVKFYFDWDWAGAQAEFERAIELDPKDPVSHQWYGVFLRAMGRDREAQREVQIAQGLDPLSLAINTDVGFHHYYAGRYDEAMAQLRMVLGMKKDFVLAHLWLARTLIQVGKHEEALAETQQAEATLRDWPVLVTARGFTYGAMGRRGDALAVLKEMNELSNRRFVTAYGMALVHTGLGDEDQSFAWLERAFEERSHWLVWLKLDPRWNALRGDSRFQALVQRMRYPE